MTLLVAALYAEALPLQQQMRRRRALCDPEAGIVWLGLLRRRPVALVVTGVGARAGVRVSAALSALHRIGTPARRVLNFGTAGALGPGRPVGSAWAIVELEGRQLRTTPGQPRASLITVDTPVVTETRRAALAGRADLCDMEAGWVLRGSEGTDFAAIKVVSDLAGADPHDPLAPGRITMLRFFYRAFRLVDRALMPLLLQAMDAESEAVPITSLG